MPFSNLRIRNPKSLRWVAFQLANLVLLSLGHAVAFRDAAAQVIDTRQGVRTYFYGSRDTNYPYGGDFYAWSMAFGDVDGDGYTDFISSAANAEGPDDQNYHESDVYLFFGRPTAKIDSVYSIDTPGVADIIFYGGGFSIACADINNDGYDDIILAEAIAHGGVYVIFGAPRDQLRRVYEFKSDRPDYTPPDVHIVGAQWLGGAIVNIQNAAFKLASRSLVAGDINGDGYADIVVGDLFACNPEGTCAADGAAYIIFGRPRDQFPPVIDVDYRSAFPHPDVVIWGDGADEYPFALAVGDLDGDGVTDLLTSTIDAGGQDNISAGRGEIRGWWGKSQWRSTYDTQIDEFDFALQGTGTYKLGYSMATGDLDGDGRDDLIIGSPTGDGSTRPPDRINMGEYRILFGRPKTLWPRWGDAVGMTDVLILGARTGDAFDLNGPNEWGICLSTATGNRDGDGYNDLLIGAGRVSRPDDGTRSGAAYLLRGRPRGEWDPLIDLRDVYDMIVYGADLDRFGFITGLADIDGDGRAEMFLGAPLADGPDDSIPQAGEISVVYGTETGTAAEARATRTPRVNASLLPNYPNPFRDTTTIPINAPAGQALSLTIYDALGREVAHLPLPEVAGRDPIDVRWSGTDDRGSMLPSGVYFVRLRAGGESHSRKITIVR